MQPTTGVPRSGRKRLGLGMRVIADFTVVPIGVGVSLSKYVAACERVLTELGVAHTLHANGTGVEGEWEEVFAAIRRCHEVVHGMGAPRISTTIKVGTRTDREQSMAEKVESVRGKGA
jgi:uncharacterized protein (TIGR00106 family)